MTTAQDQQSRAEFEAKFGPMPRGCTWTGRGYCSTEFNAWNAQEYANKFEGWQAARALPTGMEPVAWRWSPSTVFADWVVSDDPAKAEAARGFLRDVQPLYTAAQVQAMGRVPVGVTDADLSAIYKQANGEDTGKAHPLTTANIFRAMRALLAAAPRPPATPTTEPQAPTTGAGSVTAGAAPVYRLLQRDIDTIQADDEFLRDDAVTWQADPQGIFVGMAYMSNVLRPARRAIESCPEIK